MTARTTIAGSTSEATSFKLYTHKSNPSRARVSVIQDSEVRMRNHNGALDRSPKVRKHRKSTISSEVSTMRLATTLTEKPSRYGSSSFLNPDPSFQEHLPCGGTRAGINLPLSLMISLRLIITDSREHASCNRPSYPCKINNTSGPEEPDVAEHPSSGNKA